jgi:hypothetical protein
MFPVTLRRAVLSPTGFTFRRFVSTLEGNPYIYVFPSQTAKNSYILSLLPSNPASPELALGVTSDLPPTSHSLQENGRFSNIMHSVIAENAHADPEVIAQAKAFASSGGSGLGSLNKMRQSGASGGGASDQGGMGGGGRGGWVHVSDQRNRPDYGRIAWPEDIFGSVEVNAEGNFVDGHGRYQQSGTYRMVTRDGILGLSPFLREKLVERLNVEEANLKNSR